MTRFTRRLPGIGVLTALALSTALPTSAAESLAASGEAQATSVLVRLKTGTTTTSIATDDAIVMTGTNPRAFARLITGSAAGEKVGSATLDRSAKGSERETLSTGVLKLGSSLDLKLASASVAASIADSISASSVDLSLGDIDFLNGFATIDVAKSSSDAIVTDDLARTTRSITIGELEAFAIGDLLRALGSSPLDLACGAVENLGPAVGVDTSGSCARIAAIDALLADALDAVADSRADLVALKDATIASIAAATTSRSAALTALDALKSQRTALESATAGLDRATIQAARDALAPTCGVLVGPALTVCNDAVAAYDAQLALFTALDSVNANIVAKDAEIAAITALILALNATLNSIIDSIAALDAAGAVTATCDGVGTLLSAVGDLLPATSATLDPIATQLSSACADLAGVLRALIAAPLISMGGIDISIDAIARTETPSVTVSGTIGELRIGLLDPIAIDLNVVGDAVDEIEALVGSTLGDIVSLFDLDIPLPTVSFLTTETSKGRRTDGSWFAEGAVSTLRISMPSATITLPDVPPLGALADGEAFVPRVAPASSLSTPAIAFDLAKFDAASGYVAALGSGSGGDPDISGSDGGRLPKTGVTNHFLIGLMLLAAALGTKKILATR